MFIFMSSFSWLICSSNLHEAVSLAQMHDCPSKCISQLLQVWQKILGQIYLVWRYLGFGTSFLAGIQPSIPAGRKFKPWAPPAAVVPSFAGSVKSTLFHKPCFAYTFHQGGFHWKSIIGKKCDGHTDWKWENSTSASMCFKPCTAVCVAVYVLQAIERSSSLFAARCDGWYDCVGVDVMACINVLVWNLAKFVT